MHHATALIAEDEPLLAQALAEALAEFWPDLRLLPSVGDGASAVATALAQQPDVLWLDIRMPGLGGLEAAAQLAEEWPADVAFPALVFVTAYDQYALQAFDAQAVDYLLKPVLPERLQRTVARVQALLRQRGDTNHDAGLQATLDRLRGLLEPAQAPPGQAPLRFIQASRGSNLYLVPVDEVVYLEAADKYVRVLTASQEWLIRTPLKELLPRLDPQAFWQVHRGTVVRAAAIREVRRDEAGRVWLALRERPEPLAVSRLWVHRFKAM